MHLTSSRLRPAAAMAALALLAGCGGADTAAPDRLSPVEAVRAAASQTAEAGSSRYEMTLVTEVQGQSVEMGGGGVMDPATGAAESTFTLPGGAGTIEQRVVDGTMYMTLPNQTGWYAIAVEDLVGTQLASAAAPTDAFAALTDLAGGVEEVGEEDVRGEPATRYRGAFPADVAREQFGGALGEAAGKALASIEEVPFEVWIDDQGRVRRYTTTVDIPASDATGGEPVSSSMTMELFDFGVEVDVQAPPADEVQDGQVILDGLRGLS
ncbi:MAG TPA: LppX_LprAFG lipoprotein [Mycobacteriales bacterium]|nr:LppX_LprAFG lipoprotein [Mycobacteriales bacterium]